jgi:pentatricopeptide repeat protein
LIAQTNVTAKCVVCHNPIRMPSKSVSFTAMMKAYAQDEHNDEALKLFQKMHKLIAGYAQTGNVEEALELFQKMPERDVVSWNVVITIYTHNGYIDEALKLSDKMPR